MVDVEKVIESAEQQCRNNGTRLTKKRKIILSGLLSAKKALSAYELIDVCKENEGVTFPAMTVYRILEFLQQQQLAHKLSGANKFVACAHIVCNHSHEIPQFLICGKCQRVEEFSIGADVMNVLKNNVAEAGFHLVTPQFEMNCICEACLSH